MKKPSRIDRRRFIGRTAVAVGAVAASSGLLSSSRASLRWRHSECFPDGPATLEARLEGTSLDGEWVEASMVIETPREILRHTLGRHPVRQGEVRLETPLTYPYADHVRGDYRYRVELVTADGAIHTSPVIGYAVRRQVRFV
jgi:hypothetical protein